MRWQLLFAFLLAGACSKGPDADLESIKQARSLGAEWALINEQASQGKVSGVYLLSMHRWLREQLQTSAKSLTQPDSNYGEEIRALLQQPDAATPETLRAHCQRLKQIEHALESA